MITQHRSVIFYHTILLYIAFKRPRLTLFFNSTSNFPLIKERDFSFTNKSVLLLFVFVFFFHARSKRVGIETGEEASIFFFNENLMIMPQNFPAIVFT